MKFCHECGGPLEDARHCTQCGILVKASAPFCPSCGAELKAVPRAAPPAAVPPQSAASGNAGKPGSIATVPATQAAGKNRTLVIAGVAVLAIIVLAAVFLVLPALTTPALAPVSANPDAARATNIAWALNAKGRFTDANTAADTAISKDPSVADGYAMKGWALTGMGKHAEALTALDKALSLDGNNPITWSNRGFALMNLGRCPEAVTAFDRALSLDPTDYGATKYRAKAASGCPVKP